jgi:hypothetical protein
MKKFIAMIAGVITLFSAAAHAAAVQDCRHDVAPVEIGRYAADQKNNVIVSEEVIPVGSTVTMSYRVGDDMIGWVTCRTTKVRKHATVKGGEVYDIGCGNVVRKAEKAGVVRKEEPATNLDIQRPVCDGKCQLEKVCATDNGALVATEVGLVCKLPKLSMTFEQEVETNGKVTWTDKGWVGEKHTVLGPKLDVAIGKTEVNISKEVCYTQGCSRPAAKFVAEVKAGFCGIVVLNVGPKDRLFAFGKADHNGKMVMQMVELQNSDIKADKNINLAGLKARGATYKNVSKVEISRFGNDCDKLQEFVEGPFWPAFAKAYNLPDVCDKKRIAGPIGKLE